MVSIATTDDVEKALELAYRTRLEEFGGIGYRKLEILQSELNM